MIRFLICAACLGSLLNFVFSQSSTCTLKRGGLPSCNFDKHNGSLCGYHSESVGTGSLSWKKGKSLHGSFGNEILHDWQPHNKNKTGYFVYLNVRDQKSAVGSKAYLNGAIIVDTVQAVCIKFYFATTAHEGGIPSITVWNYKYYGKYKRNKTTGFVIGKIMNNTNGHWTVAQFHSCVYRGIPSLISFESEKLSNNSFVALDYIDIRKSNMTCSNFVPQIPSTPLSTSSTKSPEATNLISRLTSFASKFTSTSQSTSTSEQSTSSNAQKLISLTTSTIPSSSSSSIISISSNASAIPSTSSTTTTIHPTSSGRTKTTAFSNKSKIPKTTFIPTTSPTPTDRFTTISLGEITTPKTTNKLTKTTTASTLTQSPTSEVASTTSVSPTLTTSTTKIPSKQQSAANIPLKTLKPTYAPPVNTLTVTSPKTEVSKWTSTRYSMEPTDGSSTQTPLVTKDNLSTTHSQNAKSEKQKDSKSGFFKGPVKIAVIAAACVVGVLILGGIIWGYRRCSKKPKIDNTPVDDSMQPNRVYRDPGEYNLKRFSQEPAMNNENYQENEEAPDRKYGSLSIKF